MPTARFNASLNLSGGAGGPRQVTIPVTTASTALDFIQTLNLPAGFSTLTSIMGVATLTGYSGLLLFAAAGTTSSAVNWGAGAGGSNIVGQLPRPVHLSGGLTISNIGVCLSAATTVTLVIY